MDAVRRSRFASRQIKAGPAPLASFEDLPSDELESPEDISQMRPYGYDDESASQDLQFSTPDSLTVSSQSTPRIESDFDSQFTLTPGDSYQCQSTSELRTASLSSLSKEDSNYSIKQKKGSTASLTTLESTEIEYSQRKSSWTDIFKSHNQNSAKVISPASSHDSSEKISKKHSKSKTDYSKKEVDKSKEKGKFLSLFKKKSNKNITSPISSNSMILQDENFTSVFDDVPVDVLAKVSNGRMPVGKENESPKEALVCPITCEVQNDLGKVNSDNCDKIPDERRLSRKVINIPEKSVEKEFNILSKQDDEKKIDKILTTDNFQTPVDFEESIESSESDLTVSKDVTVDKKDDDFEAETLLTPDLSEIEEEPAIELQHFIFEAPKQVVMPSRQQRLEITTKPIDRPRSTTPINVAPLEAFIRSVSPSFDPKVEKIKLSLPGEQFTGRMKSPKKSSVKSWTDFCERGLHSPRMHKKVDKDDLKSPFDSIDGATHCMPDGNWAAFDSGFESSKLNFGDNFDVNFQTDISSIQSSKDISDSYQFESNFSFLPSSSKNHVYGCTACSKVNNFDLSPQLPDCSLSCENCSCECHYKGNSDGKSPGSFKSFDTFDAPNIFSITTDEQF